MTLTAKTSCFVRHKGSDVSDHCKICECCQPCIKTTAFRRQASDDRLAGESLNSEQRPDHQSAPSEDKAKRQYIQLRSYISVGYSNGVRFCFAGNGCRQPTVVNDASSFSKSEHFYELEKYMQ